MNVKTFLKQIIPPFLLDLYRHITGRAYIWEGIYQSFKDVPAVGQAFSNDTSVRLNLDEARRAVGTSKDYKVAPSAVVNEDALFCMLAALACRRNGGELTVLDFGGGLGMGYIHLLSSVSECSALDYHIVELDWVCRAGRALFLNDGRVHFHASLSDVTGHIHVVHLKTVLMYIEDYSGLLKQLCDYGAEYVLISDLFSGDFPTFASAQKGFEGTVHPHWFFNTDEIVSIMRRQGYELTCRGATERVYNQNNFPADRRMEGGRASLFLFSRAVTSGIGF